MKNGTGYKQDLANPPAVHRRREREHLAHRTAGGTAAAAARPLRSDQSGRSPMDRKQTGRRYGPGPVLVFEPVTAAPPMSDARRAAAHGLFIAVVEVDGRVVRRPLGGTARQRRQWTRMHRRHLGRT